MNRRSNELFNFPNCNILWRLIPHCLLIPRHWRLYVFVKTGNDVRAVLDTIIRSLHQNAAITVFTCNIFAILHLTYEWMREQYGGTTTKTTKIIGAINVASQFDSDVHELNVALKARLDANAKYFFWNSSYKVPWYVQFYVVLWRCVLNILREPNVSRIRFLQITVSCLFLHRAD